MLILILMESFNMNLCTRQSGLLAAIVYTQIKSYKGDMIFIKGEFRRPSANCWHTPIPKSCRIPQAMLIPLPGVVSQMSR